MTTKDMKDLVVTDAAKTLLMDDICHAIGMDNEKLFSISNMPEIQIHWLQRRFEELVPQIAMVNRLADEVGVSTVTSLDGIVPLLLPHTMYKSYSARAFEQRRYGELTAWLSKITSHDLSGVDLDGCSNLEEWLDRVEGQTPLRVQVSSGTSGKISIFPRSTVEEKAFVEGVWLKWCDPYRGEPAVQLRSGENTLVCPWPVRSGRHNVPTMLRLMREAAYNGDDSKIITIGQGHQSVDELALAGKLRAADNRGEALELSAGEEDVRNALASRTRELGPQLAEFIDRAIVDQKGGRVLAIMVGPTFYQLAVACQQRGIVAEWHPESVIYVGGGNKGFDLPENWEDVCREVFPVHWVSGFGMSEANSTAHECSAGHLHFFPWIIPYVVDPTTGAPSAREGVQTGRLATFDLSAQTYWGGIITGDKVTLDFTGRCSCGREGVRMQNHIERYASAAGEDDKISCAKTPGAYQRLEEYSIGGQS